MFEWRITWTQYHLLSIAVQPYRFISKLCSNIFHISDRFKYQLSKIVFLNSTLNDCDLQVLSLSVFLFFSSKWFASLREKVRMEIIVKFVYNFKVDSSKLTCTNLYTIFFKVVTNLYTIFLTNIITNFKVERMNCQD